MEMVNKQSTFLGLRPGQVFPVFYCEAAAGSGLGVSPCRCVGLKGANAVSGSHDCPPRFSLFPRFSA